MKNRFHSCPHRDWQFGEAVDGVHSALTQNLKTLGVAVIIIDVRQSTSEPLMLLAPHVEMALQRIQRGQMMLIEESGAITLLA